MYIGNLTKTNRGNMNLFRIKGEREIIYRFRQAVKRLDDDIVNFNNGIHVEYDIPSEINIPMLANEANAKALMAIVRQHSNSL